MATKQQWIMRALCACLCASPLRAAFQEEIEGAHIAQEEPKKPQEPSENKRYLFGTIELPVRGYELSQCRRYVGETKIPLKDLVSRFLLTLTTNAPLTAPQEAVLAKTYGIKKARHLVSTKTSHTYLFERTAKQPDSAGLLDVVNRLHADKDATYITSASPVFRFSDEPQHLTGKIIMQWGAQISKERAEALVKPLKLSVDSFDEKTRIMLASPTAESGFNVFELADAFSPQQGNAFVTSVEPKFAPIESPVRVLAHLVAGDGKGYGSNVAGSLFRYTLTIWARKNAAVKLNELRETSSAIKKWLPVKESADGKQKPVSSQVFVLEGSAAIQEKPTREGIREFEITYAFRMHEAGSFQLASPSVFYTAIDTQRHIPIIEELQGSPVELLVGSVLPEEATMVNSPAGIPAITLANPFPAPDTWQNKAQWSARATWILAAIAVVLCIIAFFPKMNRKEIPLAQQAFSAWRTHASALAKLGPENNEQFWKDADAALRETLGIFTAGDSGLFKAAQSPEEILREMASLQATGEASAQEVSELLRSAHLHRFGGITEPASADERQQFMQRANDVFKALGGHHALRI